MKPAQMTPRSISEYIAAFPADKQTLLNTLADTIRAAAPGAQERISYGMPAFFLDGILVYFALQARHIGFYPTPEAISFFAEDLRAYKTSKGAIQFPLDAPLPLELIRKIVAHRVQTNRAAKTVG
ncbi:MAG: hypothetical protein GX415_04500 [Chloroflexi bacterium]|jgi:uncharacterized protein YdhG (YjbR/CyaY superfamily)|nr:DUF1801 domain-containing protein [Anaerolineaceae bacterium]NLI44657.1 hypothetical protein [Chloroflexota bacterium]HOE35299.1 DUF1801 domain-containing protein [Anaerolineaceae bacterium]HOT25677.1 DUF1801 domain-containing protein [Anaerolineaceae bacterium]HQH57857.1 DUF1801 domain-containing protein [Anaerolineaceae bacterium]